MDVVRLIVVFVRAFLVGKASLAAENLALRQQVIVLRRGTKQPEKAVTLSMVVGTSPKVERLQGVETGRPRQGRHSG